MAFESLLTYSYSRARRTMFGGGYDERTFRHLLSLERMRADNAGRPLLLALVSLERAPEASVRMSSSTAAGVLDSLVYSVREVDIVGWYRQARVAGAVLVQGADAPKRIEASPIGDRIANVVRLRVPTGVSGQMRVRVIQLPRRTG